MSNITKYIIIAVTTALVTWSVAPQAQLLQPSAVATGMPGSFADIVEKLSPAVINISTKQKITTRGRSFGFSFPFEQFRGHPGMEQFDELFRQFGQSQRPREREVSSLGSGFVISADGYIITNAHVISGADQITIRFNDDRELEAKVIGEDKKTDLALLKVEPKKPLIYVPFGDSDKARVGDWVIAIGNPFGLGGTVTSGIISARQRSINAGPYDDFIQTDAAINRGNSGGPLFNLKGEVIGINSAIFSPTGGNVGIGFSIPSALAEPIIDQLKKDGKARRGWLGVKIQDVTKEVADSVGLKQKSGALVVDIDDTGPAKKAGIQPGDVITHFGGKEIKEMRFLPRIVAESKIGKNTTVTVWRKGQAKKLTIRVAELEDDQDEVAKDSDTSAPLANGKAKQIAGLSLVELTEQLREELGLASNIKGIVIVKIDPDSDAARRGMRRGDVVMEVNNTIVNNVPHFKRLLEDAKKAGRKFALLRIVRAQQSAFVTLPLEE